MEKSLDAFDLCECGKPSFILRKTELTSGNNIVVKFVFKCPKMQLDKKDKCDYYREHILYEAELPPDERTVEETLMTAKGTSEREKVIKELSYTLERIKMKEDIKEDTYELEAKARTHVARLNNNKFVI